MTFKVQNGCTIAAIIHSLAHASKQVKDINRLLSTSWSGASCMWDMLVGTPSDVAGEPCHPTTFERATSQLTHMAHAWRTKTLQGNTVGLQR